MTQVANETGLSATSDLTVIVSALNRALRRILSQTYCYRTSGSITGAGSADVSLATLTGLLKIQSVQRVDSSGYYGDLHHASVEEVLNSRPQSVPTMYAYDGGTLYLDGTLATNESVFVRFVKGATALANGGAESTITVQGIPAEFHEDLLATLAVALLMEGYEGDEQRAAYYRSLATDTLERFKVFLRERRGDNGMNSRAGASHFHTPNPLELR